jgi:predicted DNA binding CopG/RHH family protein
MPKLSKTQIGRKRLKDLEAATLREGDEYEANKESEEVAVDWEETKRFYDRAGLKMISIRLPVDVVDQLKKLAAHDGLNYQPFVRSILTKYVRKHSNK